MFQHIIHLNAEGQSAMPLIASGLAITVGAVSLMSLQSAFRWTKGLPNGVATHTCLTLGSLLIQMGVLVGCAVAANERTLWGCGVMLAIPWFFNQVLPRNTGKHFSKAFLPGMVYLALYSVGYWGLLTLPNERIVFDLTIPIASMMMVFLLSGLGGLIDWFPFPATQSCTSMTSPKDETDQQTLPLPFEVNQQFQFGYVITHTLLPCLSVAFLMHQLVRSHSLPTPAISMIAVVALFTGFVVAIKLLQENNTAQRLRLACFSMLSFSLITVCLIAWQQLNLDRIWSVRSNIPSGESLFLQIAVIESLTITLLIVGHRLFISFKKKTSTEDKQTAGNTPSPPSSWLYSIAMLPLAGLPPFPNFWWRFELITALMMPHERSTLTALSEPHQGFIVLCVCTILMFTLTSLAHFGHSEMQK